MRKIDIKPILMLLMLMISVGFTSCTSDETETLVTPKTLEQYRTESLTFINGEITKVTAVVVGFNKGDFKGTTTNIPNFDPYKASYLAALNTAKTEVVKTTATIASIVTAQNAVTASGTLFNTSLWTADRRALNDLVVSVTALNSATLVGTTAGTVSQATKDTLTAAVTAAKSVRDSSTSNQRIIDAAVVTLTDAQTAFNAAKIK